MPNFTCNNHLRFGWGEGEFNFLETHLPMWVKWGSRFREPKTFKEECIVTAHLIGGMAEWKKKKVIVCMSGGYDSEMVARSFMEAGESFEVLISTQTKNQNLHDICRAFDFCQRYGIKYHTFEVDPIDLLLKVLENDVYPHVLIYNQLQIELLKEVHRLGGLGVICAGERAVWRDADGELKAIVLDFKNTTTYHWLQDHPEVDAVAAFFLHTQHMLRSYFSNPLVDSAPLGDDGYSLKESIYLEAYPEMDRRPKLAGYETFARQLYNVTGLAYPKWKGKLSQMIMNPKEFYQ